MRALTPIRESIEKRASQSGLRDVFLCCAWNDRGGVAKELRNLLESLGVSVWSSGTDVLLSSPLLHEIEKGLAQSHVGALLVTPALLRRLDAERGRLVERELSELLARNLLVPILHDTTFEALRNVSPLLGSRGGLSTAEDAIEVVGAKLAELVAFERA